jgi:hypothetical protein
VSAARLIDLMLRRASQTRIAGGARSAMSPPAAVGDKS